MLNKKSRVFVVLAAVLLAVAAVSLNQYFGTFNGNLVGTFNGIPITSMVTNYTGIMLFSNKVCWIGSGYASPPHWTNFPNSTTAGLEELQEMFPYTTNGPAGNGIDVLLGGGEVIPGDNSWTNPVDMTNGMTISGPEGGNPFATVLRYTGAAFSVGQITNPPPDAFPYNGRGAGAAILWCNSNHVNSGSASLNLTFNMFRFQGFTLQMSTTNPCCGIGGQATTFSVQNVPFVGPHWFKTNYVNGIAYYLDNQWQGNFSGGPQYMNLPPYLIAVSMNVAQSMYIGGPYTFACDEFSCGFESYGNSQTYFGDQAYAAEMGKWSNGVGSIYPLQSLYSQGVGFLIDGGTTYQGLINYPLVYDNNIDIGIADQSGNTLIQNFSDQQANYTIVLDNVNGGSLSFMASSGTQPNAYLWTNGPAGQWAVDANITDANYAQFNNGTANATFSALSLNPGGNLIFSVGNNNPKATFRTGPQGTILNAFGVTNLPIIGVSGFAIVNTNWILGGKYSLPYPAEVNAKAVLTASAITGACELDLEIAGNTTNTVALQTTVVSISGVYTNMIVGIVPANTTFDFTNRSAGAGDSAAVAGGQYIQY